MRRKGVGKEIVERFRSDEVEACLAAYVVNYEVIRLDANIR